MITANGCNTVNSKVVWRLKYNPYHVFIIYRKMTEKFKTKTGAEYYYKPIYLLQYFQSEKGKEIWFNSKDKKILKLFVKWIIKNRIQVPPSSKKINVNKYFFYMIKVLEYGSVTKFANSLFPNEKRKNCGNNKTVTIHYACKKMGLKSQRIRKNNRFDNLLIIEENTPAKWYFDKLLNIGTI